MPIYKEQTHTTETLAEISKEIKRLAKSLDSVIDSLDEDGIDELNVLQWGEAYSKFLERRQ